MEETLMENSYDAQSYKNLGGVVYTYVCKCISSRNYYIIFFRMYFSRRRKKQQHERKPGKKISI